MYIDNTIEKKKNSENVLKYLRAVFRDQLVESLVTEKQYLRKTQVCQ